MNSDKAVKKVIEGINMKRRREIFDIYTKKDWFQNVIDHRKKGTYEKSAKAMKKVATVPIEVDIFFSRVYGDDYYKDPDFFIKKHSEWAVNHNLKETDPDDSAKWVRRAFKEQVAEDIEEYKKKQREKELGEEKLIL